MIDSLIDGVAVAAIYAGVDPWNIDTPEKVERVAEALRLQRPLLRMYTNDMTTVEQALASGELVAAVTWNGIGPPFLPSRVCRFATWCPRKAS